MIPMAKPPVMPVPMPTFLPPEATPVALPMPVDLSYEEWCSWGHALGRLARAMQWWIGDWLIYGEHKYGEKFAQAAAETGFSESMLGQCQWVASRFVPARRHADLSWSHHHAVAAEGPDEADRLLAVAVRDGLTVSALRRLRRYGTTEKIDWVECDPDCTHCQVWREEHRQ